MKKPSKGDRVEVCWEDAHTLYGDEAPGSITCWDLGYFGGYEGRGRKRAVVLWREIDEFGEFRFDMKIPVRMVQSVRRLGGRPAGVRRKK